MKTLGSYLPILAYVFFSNAKRFWCADIAREEQFNIFDVLNISITWKARFHTPKDHRRTTILFSFEEYRAKMIPANPVFL